MNASTTVDRLDVRAAWRLQSLKIEGGGFIRSRLIATQLETRPRSIFAFWRPYPEVDPAALMRDLDRIRRSLEADGYYAAQVTNDVVVLQEPVPAPDGVPDAGAAGGEGKGTPGLIAVTIHIDPGTPVEVCRLAIALGDTPIPKVDEAAVRRRIPIAVGRVFTESDYVAAANLLLTYFKEHGYAGAEVKREARVDVPGNCAAVAYTALPGSPATFGETTISGLERIDPEIVRRELTYAPGQGYDSRDVAESQRRLQNLHLFSIARLNEQPMTQDGEVPMAANLREGPQHEVRAGIGYSSEEQVRGLLAWRDYNFLGGARQLGFSAKASVIERRLNADFVQPHWPGDRGRASLTYSLEQDDESTYLLTSTRVVPRVDYRLSRELSAFGFLRAEYDSLSGVSEQTKAVLADYVSSGFTVSAGFGGEWRHVDDPIDPKQGVEFRTSAENAGSILDADFTYVRLIEDLSLYQPLPLDWVLATHFRLGFATPYGGTKEIPLWDRFYSGGTNSVRGYGRRRVGPISGSDDPVGGRSLFEGSAEMRHSLYGPIGGALFVDVGDVELQSWHIDPSDAQVGVGFGLRADTPIGPVRLDLGFGLDRPDHDSLVQVHFSIGPNF